jgi:hypothetical protein
MEPIVEIASGRHPTFERGIQRFSSFQRGESETNVQRSISGVVWA